VLRIESSDTRYSGGGPIWIQSCEARCPPLEDQSHQRRLVGELLESPNTRSPGFRVEVAGARPHDTSHSP
jgi:hypothetical protein